MGGRLRQIAAETGPAGRLTRPGPPRTVARNGESRERSGCRPRHRAASGRRGRPGGAADRRPVAARQPGRAALCRAGRPAPSGPGWVGLPRGALRGVARFPGRQAIIVALNALMGLPPVVAGLLIYLALSRSGPLGGLGLLFTPGAMVIAQTVLIAPILAALSRQAMEQLWEDYAEQLR